MKKEAFYELLGELDETAVKKAGTAPFREPKARRIGFGLSAAACIGLIAGAVFWYHHSGHPVTDRGDESSCDSESFRTEEQLYTYLKDEIARNPESTFARTVRREQSIPVYSLVTPQDYLLYEISTADYSEYITMHYRNIHDDAQRITFVWGFQTNGSKSLNEAVGMLGLTEIPGMLGYYYTGAADDAGTQIYQIYWSEDGCLMQANVPVAVFGEISGESNAESYMPLTLRKEKMPLT